MLFWRWRDSIVTILSILRGFEHVPLALSLSLQYISANYLWYYPSGSTRGGGKCIWELVGEKKKEC